MTTLDCVTPLIFNMAVNGPFGRLAEFHVVSMATIGSVEAVSEEYDNDDPPGKSRCTPTTPESGSVPKVSNHSCPLGRNTPPFTAPRNEPAIVVPFVPPPVVVVVVPVPPVVPVPVGMVVVEPVPPVPMPPGIDPPIP